MLRCVLRSAATARALVLAALHQKPAPAPAAPRVQLWPSGRRAVASVMLRPAEVPG